MLVVALVEELSGHLQCLGVGGGGAAFHDFEEGPGLDVVSTALSHNGRIRVEVGRAQLTIAPVLRPPIRASADVWSSRHPENMVTILFSDPYCPTNSPVDNRRQPLRSSEV